MTSRTPTPAWRAPARASWTSSTRASPARLSVGQGSTARASSAPRRSGPGHTCGACRATHPPSRRRPTWLADAPLLMARAVQASARIRGVSAGRRRAGEPGRPGQGAVPERMAEAGVRALVGHARGGGGALPLLRLWGNLPEAREVRRGAAGSVILEQRVRLQVPAHISSREEPHCTGG